MISNKLQRIMVAVRRAVSWVCIGVALLLWPSACVLDYDPGNDTSDSTDVPRTPSSSSLAFSSSSVSGTNSSSSQTVGSGIDTLPTWKVPFTVGVSPAAVNPVGGKPNARLASYGTLKVTDMLSAADWNKLFPNRAGINRLCDGTTDFYSYDAFLIAVQDFPAFAAEGPDSIRRRELAAFLGQVSHETSGGGGSYAEGSDRYNWGLCWTQEIGYSSGSMAYRDESNTLWPPADGQSYHGRGPIQLTWNYNYGQAGSDLKAPLLANPDWVLETGANAFRTALWFWMKEQAPKPSPHAAIVETWAPTSADKRNNRWPGYGVVTNIINGYGECGDGSELRNGPLSRMGYFRRYADYLKVGEGRNVDCYSQHDFRFQ